MISSAGTYDLYARWTASSANSSAASYTVVHGGGTDVVTVNQKQNGGQWVLLGSYGFEPDAGHQVTLTAASDGAVVADPIRLIGTGPAPADIAYIHADQLGTPQKLTDAAQAIVWDRVQDPFGRQVSLTASPGITNDLRFPGQLFDAESGFHYNYFRDYDPSTGRYVQSDPIGLDGGINTYAYVEGNPISKIDPSRTIIIVEPLPWPDIEFPSPGDIWDWLNGFSYPDKVPGKYACTARCYGVPTTCPPKTCPPTFGYGVGNSLAEAVAAAKKQAQNATEPGCRAKHCSVKCRGPKGDKINVNAP